MPAAANTPAASEPSRRPFAASVSTREFDRWMATLPPDTRLKVSAARRRIERDGPRTRRPLVGTISGSRFNNLRELRIGRTVRVLFAFDPHRTPVLLVGGDKAGHAKRWYRENVPRADRLYADHLRNIGKEERCQNRMTPRRPPPSRAR